jgi:hypothetical protein
MVEVRRLTTRFPMVAVAAMFASACAPRVDLARSLEVEAITSGWTAVSGSKIVPVVTFRVKNRSAVQLRALQLNVVFHRAGEDTEWGAGFVPSIGAEGLAAGAASRALTVASPLGYTGTDPAPDLLKNSAFVDATARILAKSAAGAWTPVGDYPIARQMIAGTATR